MKILEKSVGSFERRLNRIQLRGEISVLINRAFDHLYKNKKKIFWLKSVELIIEGTEEE